MDSKKENEEFYETLNSLGLKNTDDLLRQAKALITDNKLALELVPELNSDHLPQAEQTTGFKQLQETVKQAPPSVALIAIDIQWDFVRGSLRTDTCAAKQDAVSIMPNVNQLFQMPFKQVYVSFDNHPINHCSFFDNRMQLKVGPNSPISDVNQAKMYDTLLIIDSRGVEREQTLWPTHCVQNTKGSELYSDLKPPDSYIPIYKGTIASVESYSAFGDPFGLENTGLDAKLKAAGIKTVVLCGIAFDVCVASTALDAVKNGFHVVVVEDACVGITHAGIHDKRMAMLRAGVHITKKDKIPAILSGQFLPIQHVIQALRQPAMQQMSS